MTARLETCIERTRGWGSFELGELWHYRELLFFFAWRDIKVRYKQTVLGIAWAVIQPLLQLAIFTLFLGRVANTESAKVPYVLFAYTGIVAWGYFSKAINGASNCLVGSANLITKVYFPRILIPAGILVSGLADFFIALSLALPLMAAFRHPPPPSAPLLLLLLILVMMAFTLGISLALSALQAKYRDVGYAVGFLTQLWMFATPVVYPLSFVHESIRSLCRLNPMTGLVEGFRSALLGTPWDIPALSVSVIAACLALAIGVLTFKRLERRFADFL